MKASEVKEHNVGGAGPSNFGKNSLSITHPAGSPKMGTGTDGKIGDGVDIPYDVRRGVAAPQEGKTLGTA